MTFHLGQRMRLISWDGTKEAPIELTRPCDDYWRLIGATGSLMADSDIYRVRISPGALEPRVLIRFDTDIRALGLASHNEQSDPSWGNTLWVRPTDLAADVLSPPAR